MTVNPVAAQAAASLNAVTSSQGSDGDGDHGVEPSAASTAQPSLPSGSTYAAYA